MGNNHRTKRNRPTTLTRASRRSLAHKIRHYSVFDIEKDYRVLTEIGCLAKQKGQHHLNGNKVVDQFTFEERLSTRGHVGINFYELWEQQAKYKTKPYVRNFLEFTKKTAPGISKEKMWYNLARFYFGAVQIFKPLLAMEYYCKYNPKCVLDPTMGWGGRLVGAFAIGVPKYIGIDQNARLRRPYAQLTKFLEAQSRSNDAVTETELIFADALKIDYSKFAYDMVFTSPPYYSIEKYSGQVERSKDEWDREFYTPLFQKTWEHLQPGGHYVINIPIEVYDRVAKPVLGPATTKYPLKKKERRPNEGDKYAEFVYVWNK